jgi:hypothetical protein
VVYLDTSVIVPLLTPEPASDRVTAWFASLAGVPVSADWLLTEFASAIAIKVRTGQLSASGAEAVHEEFRVLTAAGVRLAPVSRAAFQAAAEMARIPGYGLRSGDSLHLAVAREVGATTIATVDRVMTDNARRMGMIPVEF